MMRISKDMYISNTFKTNNNGLLEIIKYINKKKVKVRFLETGYERYAEAGDIRKGNVKDNLKPIIFDVGYYGDGEYTHSSYKGELHYYSIWHSMLQRCYDAECESYKLYGGIGVEVCKEWFNFQNFCKWCDSVEYIDGYQLDKDINGTKKLYSPEYCLFVSRQDNIEEACAKTWKIKDKLGDTIIVYNMSDFCRKNSLDQGSMSKVLNGIRGSHKGYSLY